VLEAELPAQGAKEGALARRRRVRRRIVTLEVSQAGDDERGVASRQTVRAMPEPVELELLQPRGGGVRHA